MGSVPRLDGEQTGREESMVRTRGAEMWMNRNALKERSASEESQGSPERVFFKKKVEEWERRLGSKRGRVASDAGVAERTEGLTKALVSTRRGDSARAGLDTGPDDAETLAQSGDTSMSDAEAVQFLFDVSASKEEEGFSSVDQFDPEAPERPVETDVTLMKIFGSGDALSDASRNGNNDGAGPVEEQQRTLEEGEGLTSRNGTRGPEESGEEKEEKVASNPRTLTPRKGALWKPNPAMHSDLTVQVEGASFQLHKSAMCARSGLLAKLTSGRPHVERTRVTLADLPGGEKTFELVVRFCYGERLHMSPGNIAGLRCAAAYLEMTEEFSPPGHLNLLTLTEAFLDAVALRTMADALRVLLGCQALGAAAEACDLPGRAMEAIAAHVARFGVEHHTRALQRPDASATEGEVAPLADQIAPASNELPGADHRPPTEAPPVSQLREKWVRQLSKLEIGTFARLLTKLENRAVDYRLVGALIVLYGQKAFPSLFWPESGYTSGERATRLPLSRAAMSPYNLSVDSDQEGKLFKTATLRSEDGEVARDRTAREYAQARGLEVLVACLPEPRDAIGPRHACALLAAARRLSAPLALQDELEERISAQLALVSADDLLLVSRPGGVGSETDVEWVLRMVAAFLEGAAWRARVARAGALAGARALEMSVERDSPEALERVKAIAPDVVEPFDDVSRRVLEGDVPTKAMSDIGGVKGVKVPVMLIESGAAESPLEQKPPAPRGKKDGARRPPWVWASLQTRRRPNMASLSPEKCESPPIADVTKPRGRAWRFGGRKAGGFDVETSTARRKGLIKSSEVENSGAASEQQPDWGALKGVPPRVTLTEGSLSGGISQPSTEPKSEKSAGDSSSVGEALAIPAQANGDDLSASSASDVAEITWYKKPAETYRGLQRYSRTTDDGESEEIYVQATAEELMGSTRTHPEGKAGFTALADFPTNEEVNNREEENVPVPRLGPLSLPEFSPPRDSTSLTSIQLPLARADPAAAAREILEGLEAAAAPSRSELVALGAILDEFLKTVAEDSELDVDAFCALATCLPGAARPEDDGLYVALVTFLTAHPTVSQRDDFLLSRCVDWVKLSEAAREIAAANDVIPDHARMQVLMVEQRNLKRKLQRALANGLAAAHPNEPRVKNPEQEEELRFLNLRAAAADAFYDDMSPSILAVQGLAAATEAGGGPGLRVVKECAQLKREHQRLAVEGALVKMRLAELERDHFALVHKRRQRLGGFLGCFWCARKSADFSKLEESV